MTRLFVPVIACLFFTTPAPAQQLPANSPERPVTTIDLGAGPPATRINERSGILLPRGNSTFFWSPESGLIDLGPAGEIPPVTHGRDLNDFGQIVGDFRGLNGNLAPFLWSLTSGFTDLSGTLIPETPARAINNAGQVAGGDLFQGSAFRWSAETGLEQINPLAGCCGSAGLAINQWGDIVGASSVARLGEESYHAFLWSGARVIDLGMLGGDRSEAVAINNVGQVIGWSITEDVPQVAWPEPLPLRHGFFWSERDGMVDIGTLGGAWTNPTAVNDFGEVVGVSETAFGAMHAFHWTQRAGMTDLGPGAASSVNNMGQIAGDIIVDGQQYAGVWTPTGVVLLAPDATAIDINNQGEIVGGTLGADPHAILWRIPTTLAERIAVFEALVAAYAYGRVLTPGEAAAVGAAFRQARKFALAGKTAQTERALTRATEMLARRLAR